MVRTLVAVGLLALGWLSIAQHAVARERQAMLITETRGFVHDSIPAAVEYLTALGRRSSRFDVVALSGVHELSVARLRRADALLFVNTTGELPLSARQRRALLRFVRRGGGLVGTHSATDTFHDWPAWPALLGGEFTAHPWTQAGRVVVEDRRHPATADLGQDFTIHEEFYVFQDNPRRGVHVLARLDVGSVGGDPAEDRPLVWCREEGRGRVFYDALGHFQETWADSRHRRLVSGGLRWALGLAPYDGCAIPRTSARSAGDMIAP